jgi:hypothetical protein
MSTLVTTNLKHGGASGNNIVLNSDGSTTVSGALTLGTSPLAVPSGSAPSYTCRAWVNFDGTGAFSPNPSTTKIRASGNVTSITDLGTGYYTVNFTTAMPDANYSAVCGAASSNTYPNALGPSNKTTSSCDVRCLNMNDTATDPTFTDVAIFR